MRVEFLYWEECPSHPEALERLHRVLREEGVSADVRVIHVGTPAAAHAHRFPGSPTIRVEGRDVQPETARAGDAGTLTCRLYQLEDGRPSPLPSEEMIRRTVRAAREANPAGRAGAG